MKKLAIILMLLAVSACQKPVPLLAIETAKIKCETMGGLKEIHIRWSDLKPSAECNDGTRIIFGYEK